MRLPFAFCAGIAASLLASPLHAQPSAGDKPLAEALFQDGRELYLAGKVAEACAKFGESQRVEPKLGTLLNIASCHEELGRTATAWAEFTEAIAQAERTHQDARAEFAREHAVALEKRLSRLVLQVGTPRRAGRLLVRIDSAEFGESAIGTTLPVDPGDHAVSVSAAGKKTWQKAFRIEAGPSQLVLAIPDLEDDVTPPPVVTPLPMPSAPFAPEAPRTHTGSALLGGVAVLGLGFGTYFGLRAFSKRSDANTECTGSACSQRGLDLYSDAKVSANVSTVAFGVGVVSAVAAVYMFFVESDPVTKAAAVRVAPLVGYGVAGAVVGGRF